MSNKILLALAFAAGLGCSAYAGSEEDALMARSIVREASPGYSSRRLPSRDVCVLDANGMIIEMLGRFHMGAHTFAWNYVSALRVESIEQEGHREVVEAKPETDFERAYLEFKIRHYERLMESPRPYEVRIEVEDKDGNVKYLVPRDRRRALSDGGRYDKIDAGTSLLIDMIHCNKTRR
ncbi:MAG: hypothetical protein AABX47_04940 [Nanoarchaeota archaeon]